jgi:hypothetical protein
LDKADRRFVLSYAERFLAMQMLEPNDFCDKSLLILEKRFEDGKMGHIKVKEAEELDNFLKDGWKIIDPKED